MAKRVKKPSSAAVQRPPKAVPAPIPADASERIAAALERLAPSAAVAPDFTAADAFVWYPDRRTAGAGAAGQSRRDVAAQGHRPHARRAGREHRALRQGPAGQQRAALGRARHGQVLAGQGGACLGQRRACARQGGHRSAQADRDPPRGHREPARPDGADLRGAPYRFIVFCDDLSFEVEDTSYKSLKAVLEGGIEGRPDNVVFYATSNRRHLMARDMVENERSTAINPGEAVEEKVSLSDRFGLWLGFHRCSQDEYLAMVEGYVAHFQHSGRSATRCAREALEWATTRGARSGRVAWQYVQDLAGRLGVKLEREAEQARYAPLRKRIGSSGVAPLRISKCNCGALTLPVWPDLRDHLPALDLIAALDHQFLGVRVGGDVAVGMAHQHQIAVALELVAGIGDDAVLGGLHRRALGHGEVDAVVLRAVRRGAEARDDRGPAPASGTPAARRSPPRSSRCPSRSPAPATR